MEMCRFLLWYPRECSRLYNLHPWYWNSLLYSLISSWKNSAHFLQPMSFTSFQFFVSPGTYHCWVGRGSMEWEVCLTLLQMTMQLTIMFTKISEVYLSAFIYRTLSWRLIVNHQKKHRFQNMYNKMYNEMYNKNTYILLLNCNVSV